jgi:hypothetical protein
MFPLSSKIVMNPGFYERLVRICAWAFVVMLVQAFDLSNVAQAACSHFVRAQSDPLVDLARLDDLFVPEFSSSDALASRLPVKQPAPNPRKPCSGLRCSSPTPLPPSAAFAEPIGADQCIALRSIVSLAATSAHAMTVDDYVRLSPRRAHSIFHPPPFSK